MQRRITLFSLSILLKSILGQPLAVQEHVDSPINYESPVIFYEKLLSIAFLVLLGGVFAGT
jgi:hypothetical protein